MPSEASSNPTNMISSDQCLFGWMRSDKLECAHRVKPLNEFELEEYRIEANGSVGLKGTKLCTPEE